jgi:hypothetical protein
MREMVYIKGWVRRPGRRKWPVTFYHIVSEAGMGLST